MTHFEPYVSGSLCGVRYLFDHTGDGLFQHRHPEGESHNIIVLVGSVEILCDGTNLRLWPGSVYDFDCTKLHEVTAVEDGSSILNLYLHGRPPGYETLAPSDLTGSFKKNA